MKRHELRHELKKDESRKNDIITFSLPRNLIKNLKISVSSGQLSKFAANALQQALDQKNEKLKQEYLSANDDPEIQKVAKEWSAFDNEGLEDEEW